MDAWVASLLLWQVTFMICASAGKVLCRFDVSAQASNNSHCRILPAANMPSMLQTCPCNCHVHNNAACRYHKQQPIALNYQLPELERIADVADLPEPPQLYWSTSANMLNPGLLLERELSGGCNGSCMQQRPQRLAHGPEQQEKAERFGALWFTGSALSHVAYRNTCVVRLCESFCSRAAGLLLQRVWCSKTQVHLPAKRILWRAIVLHT
jgi:hypothetical protein